MCVFISASVLFLFENKGIPADLVEVKVPMGQRPSLDDLSKINTEGMKDLLDLMQKCWKEDPKERPSFNGMYSIYKYVNSV